MHMNGATGIPKANIRIDCNVTFQTMVDIGANYCNASYTKSAVDEVGNFTLDNLKPRYVRVSIPVKHWEPEDRGDMGQIIDWDRFNDSGVINTLFGLLKDMKENRGVVNITASVWDVPNYMVSNPDDANKRVIKSSMYERVARSVAAFMVRARDGYGVSIDYFSFNESNGGYQIYFTPQTCISFIKAAAPIFEAYGLKTKFLVADTYDPSTLVAFATPILEEGSIRKYLGPIAYHSWWSEGKPDSIFSDVAALARKYDLPVWCNELGYDAMLYRSHDPNPYETWDNAWRLARITYRVLKFSEAVVTQYWTYQHNFPLVSRNLSPYPAYYVTKQLVDSLPAGMQLVEAVSDNEALWTLAAQGSDGRFMIQVMNSLEEPVEIAVDGIPPVRYNGIRTSKSENMTPLGTLEAKQGRLSVELTPKSITTFAAIKQ